MPAITQQAIDVRIADLKAQREQFTMRLAAINGAIQDCLEWQRELERQEEKPAPKARGKANGRKN